MDPPDDNAKRIAAIAEVGRQTRPRVSRGTWIAAGIVGGLCAIAFVVSLLSGTGADEPSSPGQPAVSQGHSGFSSGLVLGLGIGIVLGLVIARQLADHSSRKSP